MMTTTEIIASFTKGQSIATITDKQLNWLFSQARREKIPVSADNRCVYFEGYMFITRPCKRLASGGSYVASRTVSNRHILEKMYPIRFTDTGFTDLVNEADLKYVKSTIHPFEIIKNYTK